MEQNKIRFKIYLGVFSVLFIIGVIGFMGLEGMTFTDALYFSIVTMATVGYGDIHPQTGMGKILAIIIIIGGVGTFLGVIASITDMFVNRREERLREKKLDMVTGLFFSEMGNRLLGMVTPLDPEIESLRGILKVSGKWQDKDFDRAYSMLKKLKLRLDSRRGEILPILAHLEGRADFLLRLIENPVIQEHEQFTEMLRAIFHLRDELTNRNDLENMPDSDRRHLEVDMVRVYHLLLFAWLRYVRHLKSSYGYLFSLAIRLNPFDPDADPVVKD